MLTVDFHPSARRENLRQELEESLRANRLEPKLLYVTPRQAELWRQVSLRHSPVHFRPGFRRLYDEAFARISGRLEASPNLALVGLGCGTGEKEAQLYGTLAKKERPIFFSAVDVSEELVREAAERLGCAGATLQGNLVCDLTRVEAWREWLNARPDAMPRLVTFFGLVPNFVPATLAEILRAALRPGDLLLASVHLAPVAEKSHAGMEAAMRAVVPQYDNPETLAWLNAAREAWGLATEVSPPEIEIDVIEGIPAFIGHARWETPGHPEPLRLFYSLRYTPELFEEFLRREGFEGECLAFTPCREEGIWAIQRPASRV